MKKTVGYILERTYPYVIAVAVDLYAIFCDFNITKNVDYKELLNGIVTLDSIIIGFLGAIMPVILSMKNESKFVQYVFEKDRENLFAKYLKATIFLGLLSAVLSLGMYVRCSMTLRQQIFLYHAWIFISVAFLVATYRSMSHMITLVFAKDSEYDVGQEESSITTERREEIRNKFKA